MSQEKPVGSAGSWSFMKTICYILICVAGLYAQAFSQADTLVEINDFGANPGNISLFYYAPKHPVAPKAPLVVVLHGCSETANSVNRLTGWSDLAERYGFYVLFPQQHITNNPSHCFDWFRMGDIERGKGECESIREMIGYMSKHFSIDSSGISVTGLSAGAAMSTVMIATYPELFKAAAIFAGAPYKPGDNFVSAMSSMLHIPDKAASEWKRLVREQNPAYTGPYPKVLVFHGKNDPVVNIKSAREIVKQWTALHDADSVADKTEHPYAGQNDITRYVYFDHAGEAVVQFYEFDHLGHALPVDPGYCRNQGGRKGLFGTDKNFYATFYTAYEFGLIDNWGIHGPASVTANGEALFSVKGDPLSTYFWTVPKDCEIVGESNSAQVHVRWGDQPGTVSLEEVDGKGCRYQHPAWQVKIK